MIYRWPDGKLLTSDLKKYKTLKFMANIYIVKMYDLRGKQIDIHHNDNLTEIKEDEQIEPERRNSASNKSKSKSPVITNKDFIDDVDDTNNSSNNMNNISNIGNINNLCAAVVARR